MPSMQYGFRAEFENGEFLDVVTDQRDVARYEIQPFGTSSNALTARSTTATRYLAFAGAKRQKLTKLTWDEWNAQVVEVLDAPELVGADDAADPGQPAPSEGN